MKINRQLVLTGTGLILAFAIGSLSLWGYYHYSPSAGLLENLKQQVAEGQRQLQDLNDVEIPEKRQYVAKLTEVHQSFQNISELSKELGQMFPKEERLGELLDLLSGVAESNGAKILRIKPGEPTDQGNWWEIPVELEFVCGLTELQSYLVSIERLPRFIRINSFSIALKKDAHPHLEAQMICSAFVFKRGNLKDET